MALIMIEITDGPKCKNCLQIGPGYGYHKDYNWCRTFNTKLPDNGAKLESCINSEIYLIDPPEEKGELNGTGI